MDHTHPHHPPAPGPDDPRRVALMATLHCLAGCAIGEIAGMVIGTALGWGNGATIALALVLAFVSGYALTAIPLLRAGFGARTAARSRLRQTRRRSPSWRSSTT